jgi:hypothetical protein
MTVNFEKDCYGRGEPAYMVAEIENDSGVGVERVMGNLMQEVRVEGGKFRRDFVGGMGCVSGVGVGVGVGGRRVRMR